jgi:uncharacterized membrane protein YagU involved in acid resistance
MQLTSCAGALLRGLAAGVAAGYVQNLYFKSTGRFAPGMPPDAFEAPEELQKQEMPPATVARRLVEDLMQRGPLSDDAKARGGSIVHYSYAAVWGGLWGIVREQYPLGLSGSLAYGLFVWAVSDAVVLPAFKLTALPHKYPLRNHAYMLGAHFVYGGALAGTYELLRRAPAAVSWLVLGLRRPKRLGRLASRGRPVLERVAEMTH